MMIAVPQWQGRVSPVFDVATRVLLVEDDREEGASRREARLPIGSLMARADRLVELGVDTLICGAISHPLADLLRAQGIEVLARVCGDVEEVLVAFQEDRLGEEQFTMPGCCRQAAGQCRGRRERRRGQGHGKGPS